VPVSASEHELSGVDLARVALKAAQDAARKGSRDQSAARRSTQRPRRASTVRGDGRDPIGLGAAIAALIVDRAWEQPTAGGSVLDRWPEIAPELCARVAAVGFDPSCGRLDLRPCSAAWATQVRLVSGQLVQRANAAVGGGEVVRSVRVLPPGGAVPEPPRAPSPSPTDATDRPIRPPRTGAVGTAAYRQARAALRSARQLAMPPRTDLARSAGALHEPEEVFLQNLGPADEPRPQHHRHAQAVGRTRAERDRQPTAPGPEA
jgi:predicted nucleic acid-binding Zn ribbon protein